MTSFTRPSTPNSSYSHQIPHRRLGEVQKESHHREKRSRSVERGVKKASDRLQGITSNEKDGGNGEFRFIPARVDRQQLNKGGLSQSLLPSPTISQSTFTPQKSRTSSRKVEIPIESKKDLFSFHSFALPSPSTNQREAESQSLPKSYNELSSSNLKHHNEKQSQLSYPYFQTQQIDSQSSSLHHRHSPPKSSPHNFNAGMSGSSSFISVSPGGLTNGSHSNTSSENLSAQLVEDEQRTQEQVRRVMRIGKDAGVGLGINTDSSAWHEI